MIKKITFISDTHSLHNSVKIPECDLLIHAGDVLNKGKDTKELLDFLSWFNSLNQVKNKLFIAGNHDWIFQIDFNIVKCILDNFPDIHYLCDQETIIEGLKIYGSPWQPKFCDWAFNLPRYSKEIKEKWDAIPNDTDILVTHGPAYGILDMTLDQEHAGCEYLIKRLNDLKPLVHVFGHIHEAYGIDDKSIKNTLCVNASICTENYRPINAPISILIDKKNKKILKVL